MDGTEFIFFRLIVNYIRGEINNFVTNGFVRVMDGVADIGLIFFVLWFLNKGYQMLSGASKEPMTELTLQAGKMVVVLAILHSTQLFGITIREMIFDFRDELATFISGTAGNIYTGVDTNLGVMNIALNLYDAVDSTGDASMADAKSRSTTMALVGQASPAMVGGLLSLLNEIAIGLGVVFAPIFIVSLMFKQTSSLFFGWMKYMFSAMVSMGVLAVMIAISMRLTGIYALAMVGLDALQILPTLQASFMQAGIGIILTILMVTVPGIVATFFGTSLAHFEHNRFSGMTSPKSQSDQAAGYRASQGKSK